MYAPDGSLSQVWRVSQRGKVSSRFVGAARPALRSAATARCG